MLISHYLNDVLPLLLSSSLMELSKSKEVCLVEHGSRIRLFIIHFVIFIVVYLSGIGWKIFSSRLYLSG